MFDLSKLSDKASASANCYQFLSRQAALTISGLDPPLNIALLDGCYCPLLGVSNGSRGGHHAQSGDDNGSGELHVDGIDCGNGSLEYGNKDVVDQSR